ncbi:MAG TPA: RNA polymerase sigma-54 factor, partial [Alphaproteobacteria bacterium]|nr:RNA polymerase sigma-54 factor [Alphaproteobacteria bacterium]
MTLVQRLDLRQAQTLVMTPQLQQAIKLLQLNNLEIGEFVAQELQQNPLLEESGHTDQDRPMDNTEASQDRVASAAPGEGPAAIDAEAGQFAAGGLDGESRDVADGVEHSGDRDIPTGGDGAISFAGTGGGGNFDGELTDFTERMSQEL